MEIMVFISVEVPREIAVLSNVQPEAHQKLQDTAAIKVPENLSEPSTYVMQEELFEKSIAKVKSNLLLFSILLFFFYL